ncbi:MAG: tetratricopeptide repeat protein, partial [Prevotellaceae bacterium]|nr:tetratricopeptide repeat protein [Prevotellaceae bacterium]
MKRFFAHTLTLILEFIVLGLAIAWLCSGNGKLEPMIAALTAIAAIVGSFFSRSKDCGKEKKNNNAKTWNNINSPVLQDINASVNIDYSTGKIENSGSGTIIINNIPVDIDTLKAEWTKEDKERIEELKELLATTKELHGRDRLAWDKEKTDLEQKVAYTEAKIQEIIKSYETVDMDSSPMYKEALELFINGKLDEALAVLDDATLEANEKKGADARILKAQMLELKYDFKNAEANYLKAVSIFPSFENNLRIASFYYELNEFKKSEAYLRICVALAKTTKDKACILNNLGVLQRNINELQQAEASYREALQTYRELAANNPQAYLPYVATTLNNLGTLQSYLKDYRKAEAYYQEALKIR